VRSAKKAGRLARPRWCANSARHSEVERYCRFFFAGKPFSKRLRGPSWPPWASPFAQSGTISAATRVATMALLTHHALLLHSVANPNGYTRLGATSLNHEPSNGAITGSRSGCRRQAHRDQDLTLTSRRSRTLSVVSALGNRHQSHCLYPCHNVRHIQTLY
jgi:hypothetical protein